MNLYTARHGLILTLAAVGFAFSAACTRHEPSPVRVEKSDGKKATANKVQMPPATIDSKTPRVASSATAELPKDLPGQLQTVLMEPKRAERQLALADLAAALARHHPTRAADVVKQILAEKGENDGDAYAFVSQFSSDFAALDPAAAAAWVETLPLTLRFGACALVAPAWARVDLSAATKWAEGISDLSLRTNVFRRIGQEVEGIGETQAAAWAQRLAGSADAGQHTELISRLWAKGDVQGAFQWSANLGEPERRTAAVVAVAGVVAEQDPQTTSAWVGQFPAGDLRNQAVSALAVVWSQRDPESALRWLAGLGDPPLLESNMHTAASRWLQADRKRAADWIRSAPISPATKAYLLGPDRD
jgi:hypothetical protein